MIELLKIKGAGEEMISNAFSKIEDGRVEEREQQIAFLISNVLSSLEAGQLSDAESYCAQVEILRPDHPPLG